MIPDIVIERMLAAAVIEDNGCWRCVGRALTQDGYVKVKWKDGDRVKHMVGHRALYIFLNGPLPVERPLLDHLCRNRWCINPDHVEPKTNLENLHAPGSVAPAALNKAKTHCPQGHAYDEENTYCHPVSGRMCRICMRERCRERRARMKREAA